MYIALIVIHGISTALTVGRLQWYQLHAVPEAITIELLYYDNQFKTCALCFLGKEIDLSINHYSINDYKIVDYSDIRIDTSNALLFVGKRCISIETLDSHQDSNYTFPLVNFSTLKAGEKGNITFAPIFQRYLNRLSY